MLHSKLTLKSLHSIIAFLFEDEAAQLGTVVAADDIGKVGLRQSDTSVWLLVGTYPTVWVPLGGSAGGQAPIIIPTQVGTTSLLGEASFNCDASINIGDFVYLEGNDTVALANASSIETMPCLGVVKSKPHLTEAAVQYLGDAALFVDLTPDMTYYVSPTQPGKIQSSLPAPGAGESVVLQRIGTARNSTTLILSIDATDYVVMQG